MAVSRINSTTGTSSLTFASPVAGYIQLVFAFRDGSNTAPTVPTPGTGNAWTTIGTASGGNTCSSVAVWRYVASGSDTASGTFTNATSIIGVQYSGVHASSAIGDNSDTGASSTSINFNALSAMVDTGGSSWAVGFVGHRATDGTITTAPSGMTNVTSVSDATDQAALHDTNAGVTSWSTTSASIGGTSSGYRARVIEVRAAGATTLTAGVGSYTITGTAATLKYGRTIPAAGGSYSITGTAATLKYGRTLAAAVGSYTITGTAATLRRAYTLAAAVGSYSITGTAAALKYGRTLVGDVGSYIITGTAAGLRRAYTLPAAVGSYILTGTDATLTQGSTGSAWAAAINFRDTSGYVTDDTGQTYCLGEGDTYPTVRDGLTFGWVSINADAGRDRNSALDVRLAGINQQENNGTQAVFRLDLPSTGSYTVRLALGDGGNDQSYQRVDIFDDAVSKFNVIDTDGTLTANFDDATGVNRSAAAWPGSNVAQTGLSFSSTTLFMKLGATSAQANSSSIAHLYVTKEVSNSTTLTADPGSYTLTGTAATLTQTSTAMGPNFNGDVVPGDYSSIPREYETRGAIKKRRTLPKSVVKQVAKVSAEEPSMEQLMRLAQAVIPQAGEDAMGDLSMHLLAALKSNINQLVIQEMQEQQAAEYRKRVMIEEIARFLDMLEQDELLLIYLI